MADIYIRLSDFTQPPTRKLGRELVAAFPQITGYTRHEAGFVFDGVSVAAGYVIHTDQEPEPDEAAIVAAALAHDGAEDPKPFGTAIPVVQTAADLPAQPELPAELGLVAAVVNPPGLHVYARGQWRAL